VAAGEIYYSFIIIEPGSTIANLIKCRFDALTAVENRKPTE